VKGCEGAGRERGVVYIYKNIYIFICTTHDHPRLIIVAFILLLQLLLRVLLGIIFCSPALCESMNTSCSICLPGIDFQLCGAIVRYVYLVVIPRTISSVLATSKAQVAPWVD